MEFLRTSTLAQIVSVIIHHPRDVQHQDEIMLAPAIRREKSVKSSSGRDLDQRTNRNSFAWPVPSEVQEHLGQPAAEALETVEKVNCELSRSRYPLNHIKCECDAKALLLTGVASQYYYVQIALETTLRHAGSIPVKLQVVVAQ